MICRYYRFELSFTDGTATGITGGVCVQQKQVLCARKPKNMKRQRVWGNQTTPQNTLPHTALQQTADTQKKHSVRVLPENKHMLEIKRTFRFNYNGQVQSTIENVNLHNNR
jgi:hypothetical protein